MRVYQYGLLPPSVNASLVSDQMSRAHKYRNTLVEIERGRRDAIRSAIEAFPEVGVAMEAARAASVALKEAEDAAKEYKSQHRTPEVPKDLADAVAKARKVWVAAYRKFSAQVKGVKSLITDEVTRINEVAHGLHLNAREHNGLYWGTYNVVEKAMDASKTQPLYRGIRPRDPSFVSWQESCHHIGVQLQKGQSVPLTLAGASTQLKIERDGIHPKPMRDGSPRRGALLSIRVTSDKAKPVWATFPMVMHRDLPEDGDIRTAVISRRRVGANTKWTVEITVDEPTRTPKPADVGGVMAMDIGWRQRADGGLKVASWVREDGRGDEVILDPNMVSGIRKAQELTGLRRDKFNVILKATREWVQAHALFCPEWLRRAATHMDKWKSIEKLSQLALRWRKARFDGDAPAYDMLEAWRYHDQHLGAWECNQREKSLRARREQYRVFAKKCACEYDVLVIEDFKLTAKGIAQHNDIEKGPENQKARSNRQLAAVSSLRQAMVQAFIIRGREVVKVPPENTSKRCHACKMLTALKAQERYTCEHCGTEWDRDENARANLMDLYRERKAMATTPVTEGVDVTPGEPSPAPARKTRWSKIKRKKEGVTDADAGDFAPITGGTDFGSEMFPEL